MRARSTGYKRRARARMALLEDIRQNGATFVVFSLFATVALAIFVHSLLTAHWQRAFMGVLTLLLLLIPTLVERSFALRLPCTLEILAYGFVFAAGVLGEIAGFYERFGFWDDMLHGCNGFMFAAFGFCLVGLTQRKVGRRARPAPLLVALIAFCFSMTVGVFWELFEYSTDAVLGTDMQKDTLLHAIHTVSLSAAGEGTVHLRDVTETVIRTAGGEEIVIAGYLDVGLADTMLDLFVNAIGALVFCMIGYVYLQGASGRLARQFIPEVLDKKAKNKG